MATNGSRIAPEPRFEERRPGDGRAPDAGFLRGPATAEPAESTRDFVLAPVVDKVAFSIASGLVVAMKELENHIATETRMVADTVGRQLTVIQTTLTELAAFVKEQKGTNAAIEERLQQLTLADAALRETGTRQAEELETLRTEAKTFSTAVTQKIDTATAALQDSDVRQTTELEGLRTETRATSTAVGQRIDVAVETLNSADTRIGADLATLQAETRASSKSISERVDSVCRDVGVQQEDVAAIKATLSSVCSQIDALVERLDRQAEAMRVMHNGNSQREAELEQLVAGLVKMRTAPKAFAAADL